MKIKYKGINIEITEEKEESKLDSYAEALMNSQPPIDLSMNCKCVIDDQFQRVLDKLQEEVSQTVEEFTRRRKIEEKWNKKKGKECNIEFRFLHHTKIEWLDYHFVGGQSYPSWEWDVCDYRVKEEELPDKSEYQRRLTIKRAWNGKLKSESNIEWTFDDEDNWITDTPLWSWDGCKYRVKKEEKKESQKADSDIQAKGFIVSLYKIQKVISVKDYGSKLIFGKDIVSCKSLYETIELKNKLISIITNIFDRHLSFSYVITDKYIELRQSGVSILVDYQKGE